MMPPQQPATQRNEHRAKRGVQQTAAITLLLNLLLSAAKLLIGLAGNSQALVADAIHSLSDAVTDIGILIGVRFWSAPADDRHPYGHWGIEALVTVAMGLSLMGVAVALVFRAWHTVRDGTPLPPPAGYTLIVAISTIAIKEWMYHWTQNRAQRFQSHALAANAWHQRSDALSSLPAVAAITGAILFPSLRYLDPLGAVIVSAFVLHAALRIFRSASATIMDEGLPLAQCNEIENTVRSVPGVTGTHALRTRRIGPGFHLDLHVLVPGSMSVRRSHDIAETVRQTLLQSRFRLLDVVIHIEPDDEPATLSDH